ncbi:MAG: glycosyltransferase family 4 protein [Desulfofustis sp.]|nr:glycosyltransferase family 4 protein [Desulfofustis sp.]
MRIGLVIYGSLDTLTGGYLYDKIVTEELKQRGHEIEVISLPPGSYRLNLLRGLFTSPAILLKMQSCDVLLQDELCHPSLLRFNRSRRPPKSPPRIAVVHHLLSAEPRDYWSNLLLSEVEKRYLCNVDGFIFNSQSTRQAVQAVVGEHRPQVVAYPAGDRFGFPLSPEYIATRCQRAGPLQLLFLGNLIPRKGLLQLVEKLAKIDRSNWRLSVVGGVDFDPDYAEKTQQRVRELNLSDQIQFLGMLPEDQLIGQLGQSDLLCMPFSYEGFGIAIVEAMAFGLPALCSSAGAAAETVEHGINGFLFSAADSDRLGSIITRLHQHRNQLKKVSLAAYRTAASKPGWPRTAAVIEQFLQALVSNQGTQVKEGFHKTQKQHIDR